jgi:hypothetical protein
MATSPIYSWPEPDNTDLVKNGALAIRTLGNAIDTTMGTMVAKTVVDAKGDLIAGTAADTVNRLAVGNNGETLVADSSTSTGLRYQGNFAAGKNKIINGDFGIWQRGTSFTNPTAGAFLSDRFLIDYSSGTVNCVVSQQTFTPGAAPVAGYESQYFLRVSQSAATASKNIYLRQKIEDVRSFAGQTATFSFWAKANASKTLNIAFYQYFGTGGSAGVSFTGTPTTASVTTSWQRFTVTVNVPSVSGKTIGASSWLLAEMYYDSNAIQDLDFWGWQIEAGSVATAFQTATGTIQGELAACQRYYYRQGGDSAYQAMSAYSNAVSTTNIDPIIVPLPVTMRVEPTVLDTNAIMATDGVNVFTGTFTLATQDSRSLGQIKFVGSGLTQYRAYQISANNSTSAYVGLSAEL